MRQKACSIGNIVSPKVPVLQMEDDNAMLRTWYPDGPNGIVEKETNILPHHKMLIRLDMIDTERCEQ